MNKLLVLVTSVVFITSCGGGGGGGGGGDLPAPSVIPAATSSISLSSNTGNIGDAVTISWSSTNATSCAASNAWTGTKTTSGSESFIPDAAGSYVFEITCSGSGGSGSASITYQASSTTTPNTLEELGITGNVIDGYVSGAKVFIDENFNLTFDEGELNAETNESGFYTLQGVYERFIQLGYIEAIEESGFNLLVEQELLDAYYACWRDRPIVADVPEGANDSSTGLVREPYQMVLPASISRFTYGDGVLNITPFTNFLVDAVQTVIVENEIELTLEQGCSGDGDAVQDLVTAKVNALLDDFQDTYGFTFAELVSNFMEEIQNDKITEENAQIITSWLPKFLAIKTQVGEEMSTTFEKSVYPMFNIGSSSKDALINGTDPEELEVGFGSWFRGPENDNGWYYTHSIRSWGSKLNKIGELIPFKCADGTSSCNISGYSLDDYYNASAYWLNRVSFKNDSSIPGHESKSVSINIEDENRWQVQSGAENITSGNYIDFASFNENVSQADYEAMTRSCLKLDEVRVSWAEDVLPYDIDLRYNFGYNNYEAEVLDCRDLDSIDPLHIFFLVYPDYENAQIQIQESEFLENLIINPFENRDTLNPISLLDEIDEMPKYFADFAVFRTRLIELDKDDGRQYIVFFSQDQDESLHINKNPEKDKYFENDTNEALETGQNARNKFWEKLVEDGFPDEMIGEVPQG